MNLKGSNFAVFWRGNNAIRCSSRRISANVGTNTEVVPRVPDDYSGFGNRK
ncbi:MAG: hypothetical protein NHB15_19245 [Methanosarcina barkeri]|nr:hypothetical protein [Methanosarcina sp. ERenArc_MAG2]